MKKSSSAALITTLKAISVTVSIRAHYYSLHQQEYSTRFPPKYFAHYHLQRIHQFVHKLVDGVLIWSLAPLYGLRRGIKWLWLGGVRVGNWVFGGLDRGDGVVV